MAIRTHDVTAFNTENLSCDLFILRCCLDQVSGLVRGDERWMYFLDPAKFQQNGGELERQFHVLGGFACGIEGGA